MFLNVLKSPTFMGRKTAIPETTDFFATTAPPRNYGGPKNDSHGSSGSYLVAQYIEMYCYRRRKYLYINDDNLKLLSKTAKQLDDILSNKDFVKASSEEYPSLQSLMESAISLNFVNHVNGVGYIAPTVNDIKYFTYQYGGIILECKLTNSTHQTSENHIGYIISDVGNLITEDFTKGFITCGYDASHLYVQNSLGLKAGSCGFHKIPWNIIPSLVIKGACFKLT